MNHKKPNVPVAYNAAVEDDSARGAIDQRLEIDPRTILLTDEKMPDV